MFQLVLHWSVDMHFSCFWFFTLTSGATVSSHPYLSMSVCCGLSREQAEGPPAPPGMLVCTSTIAMVTQLVLLPSAARRARCLTSLPSFISSSASLMEVGMASCFNLPFPDSQWSEAPFSHVSGFFNELSFSVFLLLLFTLLLIQTSVCRFWIQTLCLLFASQISSLSLWQVF